MMSDPLWMSPMSVHSPRSTSHMFVAHSSSPIPNGCITMLSHGRDTKSPICVALSPIRLGSSVNSPFGPGSNCPPTYNSYRCCQSCQPAPSFAYASHTFPALAPSAPCKSGAVPPVRLFPK